MVYGFWLLGGVKVISFCVVNIVSFFNRLVVGVIFLLLVSGIVKNLFLVVVRVVVNKFYVVKLMYDFEVLF